MSKFNVVVIDKFPPAESPEMTTTEGVIPGISVSHRKLGSTSSLIFPKKESRCQKQKTYPTGCGRATIDKRMCPGPLDEETDVPGPKCNRQKLSGSRIFLPTRASRARECEACLLEGERRGQRILPRSMFSPITYHLPFVLSDSTPPRRKRVPAMKPPPWK
jgi:hypothetical protein